MKPIVELCLVGLILTCGAYAQDSQRTALKQGVSVQMPVASHAVEMRAADEPDAMVVAITADGRVFAGIQVVEPGTLSSLKDETVYVKADARVSFEKVLAVLDALRGKSVVLLSAPPENTVKQGMVPPYGTRLIVSR